jgi:hypothetical protein
MKTLVWLFASSLLLVAAPAKLAFTKSFPGSVPAYCSVEIDKTGALVYKESPTDDQPLKAQMQEADAAKLFAMAGQLEYFKSPLESGLKVANTGKKTFRYEPENGGATEVTFNYSLNVTAQQLLERFEQIAETERAYLTLSQTIHYDKLGVNDALAEVESLWLRKELAAPQQFFPLLDRIASHPSFMHMVRDRAAKLKDEFQAGASGVAQHDAAAQKEK